MTKRTNDVQNIQPNQQVLEVKNQPESTNPPTAADMPADFKSTYKFNDPLPAKKK